MHRQARAQRRRKETLDLYLQHPSWTYYDLGKAVGLSAHHVGVLVREALAQAAADEHNLAQLALVRAIKLHQQAMDAAWEIVVRQCTRCKGKGEQVDEEKGRTLSDDGVVVTAMAPCGLCEYSSGYAYPYNARLGAIDRHQKALTELSKLLRLYEPETVNINVNFRADLAALPEPELKRMLDDYTTGYTDVLALGPGEAPEQQEVA